MANQYLVVSDLHLCDVEDHPDGWKHYKASRFVFDSEFAALLDSFGAEGGSCVNGILVLNGDVFDFDLVTAIPEHPPWRVSPAERQRGLKPTGPKSVWKLQRVLEQHPEFVAALARFIAAGNQVVYVLGNHDRELHFPEVQNCLVEAIRAACTPSDPPQDNVTVRFEPWFYYVPGEIYVEHGNQYDYYSSFRHILDPTVRFRNTPRIALPMGNLSNRVLMSKMGFFNPHSTDYILNLLHYVGHWFKHYALTRRNLVLSWFFGSFLTLSLLLRNKKKLRKPPPGYAARIDETRMRFGLTPDQVQTLHRLQRPPITNQFFRIVREFWIDRALILSLMVLGTIALALVPIPLWIKLMVPLSAFPLTFFIYEVLTRGENVFTVENRMPGYAREIAALLHVPLVVFGHTHVPRLLPLDEHVTFVDTGTWAPITELGPQGRRQLSAGYRNYLLVSFEADCTRMTLGCWKRTSP